MGLHDTLHDSTREKLGGKGGGFGREIGRREELNAKPVAPRRDEKQNETFSGFDSGSVSELGEQVLVEDSLGEIVGAKYNAKMDESGDPTSSESRSGSISRRFHDSGSFRCQGAQL